MRKPFFAAAAISLAAHLPLFLHPPAPVVQAPARAVAVRLEAPPAPQVKEQPATAPPARAPAQRDREAPHPPPLAPAVEAPAAEEPVLHFAGPAEWHYRLRQAGQDGEASLSWQPAADGSYVLRLSRRVGERSLPDLESLGHTSRAGLLPDRFALQRGGRDRQAINFDQEQGQVSFSASPAQWQLQAGTQDRLSWWLQLAALVQAGPTPVAGTRWRVWVAGLRGELREWTFELAEDGPSLHLRRLPLGPEDPGVELWLDPAQGFWPVRLRQGDPERRGFEIVRDESPGVP